MDRDKAFDSPDDLLFRTSGGKRPSPSYWSRAWHRALAAVGHEPLRDDVGAHRSPLAETARRLGHSVETLIASYVGALPDEERIGNTRIGAILIGAASTESSSSDAT